MATAKEVYFCGACKSRQRADSNQIACKSCRRLTVTWALDRESMSDAMWKWKLANGDF